MKKLLIGLFALGSISSFATESLLSKNISELNDRDGVVTYKNALSEQLKFGRSLFNISQTLYLEDMDKVNGDSILIKDSLYTCIIRPENSASYKIPTGDYKIIPTKVSYESVDWHEAGFLHATLFGNDVEFYLKCWSDVIVGSHTINSETTEQRYENGRIYNEITYNRVGSSLMSAPLNGQEMKRLLENVFMISQEL